ncbi:hypothetical protein F1188_17585 [Roseospira marina]|uniref:NnrS family protein n=1 Tax=Roseospira marina TaxID=140057 RepID=A0A5M6I7F0_9PROT|nr:hypothetical protein F1188_17585 [Roseospira marina]
MVARLLVLALPEHTGVLLWGAAGFWIVAFLGFCVEYGPALFRPAKG